MKYLSAFLMCCLLCVLPVAAAADAERPNIVVILVDDMGFSDIGCYGSEIPTPNLDALAEGGLRFTQFYNTGRCCPTRATLLTGLYAHQAGVGHMTDNYGVPGYVGALNNQCVTLGSVASSAGYHSLATGKWHVGSKDKMMWPLSRGFDRFYGIPEGGGFYFQVKQGRTIVRNNEVIASAEKPLPEGWYSTDAWIDNGLPFVDEAIAAGKPFLWYLAHNAPHFPLQATAEDIAMFRGKYMSGWDKLSDERYQRQLASGIISSSYPKTARPEKVAAWDSLTAAEQNRFDHMMAVYAACVYRMDKSIGTLVAELKRRNQFDNTLILFMSDNGGCAESGPQGKDVGDPTTADSTWFCGESWAWMQDTPFRKYKHYNHEGGIATPLIAHWPAGIAARGKFYTEPAHLIDIMATVADLSKATYPTELAGHEITAMEGTSLSPAFQNQTLGRETLFWEHEGNAAVREGEWKLVREGGKNPWELYNLKADRTEQNNLASEQPERVKSLTAKWNEWAERCNVSPDGLPKKQGGKKTGVKRKNAAARNAE